LHREGKQLLAKENPCNAVLFPASVGTLRVPALVRVIYSVLLQLFEDSNCKHWQGGGGGANKTGEQGENKEDDDDEGEDEVILSLHPDCLWRLRMSFTQWDTIPLHWLT
jgi:hypothetical protein